MELTDLERQRVEKLEQLRADGINPYPHRLKRTHTLAEALAALEEHEASSEDTDEGPQVAVAGRLRSMRVMGKVAFAHIEDGTGSIQLFLRVQDLGKESYASFKQCYDLGDFVGAEGPVMRTRTGESSVRVKQLRMLSKAVSPLPTIKEKEVDGEIVRFSAFSDVEERYRQRYADLASNPEVREVFRTRARIVGLDSTAKNVATSVEYSRRCRKWLFKLTLPSAPDVPHVEQQQQVHQAGRPQICGSVQRGAGSGAFAKLRLDRR